MTVRVHRAGEPGIEPGVGDGPGGPVQRCSDCGEVLQDYRGALIIRSAGEECRWWPPGAYILRDGPMTTLADTAEVRAFPCSGPEVQAS